MEPIKVANVNILKALPNHENGEVAYVENEDCYYIFNNDDWYPYKADYTSSGLKLSLYELNKSVVSQLPVFNKEAWDGAEKIVNDWFSRQLDQEKKPKYFMLYGKDISYFTVFRRVSAGADYDDLFTGLKDVLADLGDVYAIDPTEDDGAIEVWIRYIDEDRDIDDIVCLYLFIYDEGVVTFYG